MSSWIQILRDSVSELKSTINVVEYYSMDNQTQGTPNNSVTSKFNPISSMDSSLSLPRNISTQAHSRNEKGNHSNRRPSHQQFKSSSLSSSSTLIDGMFGMGTGLMGTMGLENHIDDERNHLNSMDIEFQEKLVQEQIFDNEAAIREIQNELELMMNGMTTVEKVMNVAGQISRKSSISGQSNADSLKNEFLKSSDLKQDARTKLISEPLKPEQNWSDDQLLSDRDYNEKMMVI